MRSVIFLQSDEPDPYALYKNRRTTSPIFRDDANAITGIYSYAHCKAVLNNPLALIPPINTTGLNEQALTMVNRFTRLRNPPAHAAARQAATGMFTGAVPYPAAQLVNELLAGNSNSRQINWVNVVGKQLPVLMLLKGFDFSKDDCAVLTAHMELLVKIMLPNKSEEQIAGINEVAAVVYPVIERQLLNSPLFGRALNTGMPGNGLNRDEWLAVCVSNLAGLLIQSYDACRGLLSNAMLQLLKYPASLWQIVNDETSLKKFVVESLRYDPPVQNTRRVAAAEIVLADYTIKKGEMLLIVLASANRDDDHFSNAATFDLHRSNNAGHLTFGAGPHACLAANFAIDITMAAIHCFFEQYPHAKLHCDHIQYEASVNGRLPKDLMISLT